MDQHVHLNDATTRLWKRGRLGHRVLLAAMALVLSACPKNAPPVVPPAVRSPDPVELADRQFEAGNYAAAVRSYDAILKQDPPPATRERVLFRLGLTHAVPTSGVFDLARAVLYFKQLLGLFPEGIYRPQVDAFLNLFADLEKARADNRAKDAQLKTLTNELEKLKKIDMQRRPSRPPV